MLLSIIMPLTQQMLDWICGRPNFSSSDIRRQYNLHEVGMTIGVAQLRAARGLVGWSQQELADKAEVGRATIADFEAGKRVPYATTLQRLQETLTVAGVEFIPENGGGAGVRLRGRS
jgi:ribosome-binding protein aMBF1 (putative translation factor)